MRNACLTLTFLALAAPAAGAPLLSSPVDCELGETCYIQQYMDHDPTEGSRDFMCGSRSYNTHKGTDFAVPTVADAKRGIDVIAAAAGKVMGVRDGMADAWNGTYDENAINGRECGNGLVIDHGEGWQTQYCHLRNGSIAVSKNDQIESGTYLGQIGMSGRTEFAHLHLSLRKDGKPVDPFAPNGPNCGATPTNSMWLDDPLFQAGGILEIGFSEDVPDYSDVKMGKANQGLKRISPALVSYVFIFGGKIGDTIEVTFTGPGDFKVEQTFEMSKNLARFFRAIGKKRRSAPWPGGLYQTSVQMIRDGKIIDAETASFEITR